MSTIDLYSRLLHPLDECWTPKLARKIAGLRAEPSVRRQIQSLATKCNDGVLTAEERSEYEAIVHAIQFLTTLQSRARQYLKSIKSP